jgi:hypothetical protein
MMTLALIKERRSPQWHQLPADVLKIIGRMPMPLYSAASTTAAIETECVR